jgi:death-on-curing protein
MQGLSFSEVLDLHKTALEHSGGLDGIRDFGALHSALVQPCMTFGGLDLYPSIVEKAAALCFSLVMNHPFIDGNKRVGHAAMEAILLANGLEVGAPADEQEVAILNLAAGQSTREEFTRWLQANVRPIRPDELE